MNTAIPPTTCIITMTTDAKLLTLMQWLSPNYPVGAFAWSHGLEGATAAGWVHDRATLQAWIKALIADGSIWSDAVLIAQAYGSDDLETLNATARALAASKERLDEATRQGAAFAKITRDVWGMDLPDLQMPVALGRAGRLAEVDCGALIALYAQSFASNLTAAAQRLMPLGQTDAQAVLAALAPDCMAVAARAQVATLDDIYANTFLSDIAAMRHETLPHRVFQS